ncbi:MAG TPA: gamma-glutamyl-gamma-aminobutyrate hydrolase family protein [Gaiellaceae bacterium]|nr:gamma-glutamyl-gamma-aminobutyrate hydrolase family protein [Gaiellaceae bacterium]
MARPLIGITSYAEEIRWGVWTEDAALIPLSYVRAVDRAGGRPLVVPPSEDGLQETLDALDGVIFSGGGDLDPGLYDAEPHPETDEPRAARDAAELRMLEAALERDMPVLAVCRGSQVLNVARGGDLVQHLPEELGHDRHRHQPGSFSEHDVTVASESRLGALLGDRAPVKSHHHQAYGRIGDGLREVAWAAEDGVVEGLEDPQKRFALGVLWHPEEGEDFALFNALVEEAGRYREERR